MCIKGFCTIKFTVPGTWYLFSLILELSNRAKNYGKLLYNTMPFVGELFRNE